LPDAENISKCPLHRKLKTYSSCLPPVRLSPTEWKRLFLAGVIVWSYSMAESSNMSYDLNGTSHTKM